MPDSSVVCGSESRLRTDRSADGNTYPESHRADFFAVSYLVFIRRLLLLPEGKAHFVFASVVPAAFGSLCCFVPVSGISRGILLWYYDFRFMPVYCHRTGISSPEGPIPA